MKHAIATALLCLSACTAPDLDLDSDLDLGEQAYAIGEDEDGASLDGETLQGRTLVGQAGPPLRIAYDPVRLEGRRVTDVRIVAGRLVGQRESGRLIDRLRDEEWIGAVFQGHDADGGVALLRVASVTAGPSGDARYYTLRHGDGTPFCDPDVDGNIDAVPVAAVWNLQNGDRVESSDRFTFACRKGVISKCIGWGYRPWLAASESLVSVHQACTRAARADYCGNGNTNTLEGTAIRIYDDLDPYIRDRGWLRHDFESAWSTHGARCLSHLRWEFLRPECDTQVEPGLLRGPFDRDELGNKLDPRECDTPAEASDQYPGVTVFTESHTQTFEDIETR